MALEKVTMTGCTGEGAPASGFGYIAARRDSASFNSAPDVSPPPKKVDAQLCDFVVRAERGGGAKPSVLIIWRCPSGGSVAHEKCELGREGW